MSVKRSPGGPSSSTPAGQPQAGDATNTANAAYFTAPQPSAAGGPKKGVGFSNVYSMNTLPPSPPPVQQRPDREPAQGPPNDGQNVPPPPPGPNQGVLPTGPSNIKRPTLAPPPFSGPKSLLDTGIFSGTGIRDFDIEDFIDKAKLPDTPSKTNNQPTDQVQNLVEPGMTDEQLLDVLRRRVDNARGDKTVEQRKDELRESLQPWLRSGLRYKGPRRPGLYLPDGTRNPARPARGAARGPPPPPSGPKLPANPERPPVDTGNPPSDPKKAPKSTKEPQPTSKAKKSSTGTGNKSTTGTGTSSSTGTKAPPPPTTDQEPQNLTGTGKDLLSVPKKKSSSGVRKGSTKGNKQPSPLSKPPIRPEDVQDVIVNPPTGTDGPGWQSRDDLFEAQVMDAAGIEYFIGKDEISALPTLASTIDYNTENWE